MTSRLAPALLLTVLLLAAPGFAHDTKLPVEGAYIDIANPVQPFKVLDFDGAGQAIQRVHDPTIDGFSLLLVGLGATPSRSELVHLDPSRWSFTPGAGYTYGDPSGSAGGITRATYDAGVLEIESRIAWAWQPSGVLDALQVHIQVGDQWYCAEFDVAALGPEDVIENDGSHFQAQNAPAPLSCPDVCGNGDLEEGEECDDGNLAEDDGCTNDCRVGACFGDDYASTFEAIQSIIFDGYSCNNSLCHNPANPLLTSQLDLTAPNSYLQLLGADLQGAPSTVSTKRRVVPTEPDES
ncbi:MAG: hypothetical protein VCC67_03035, partial [Myxococcota bacterium]